MIDNIVEKYLNENEKENDPIYDEYLSDLMEQVFKLIDSIDDENLTEEQEEIIEKIIEMYDEDSEDEDSINENVIKKVIRHGKLVRKVSCKKGWKSVHGKCVKMTPSEIRVRSKSAKKSARKRKSKQTIINKKRERSMKKRKNF